MAELNNEEIRSTLQDLISSPDFNVNDPDTKRQLNNILNQINVYNYLNHNKNYIAIRCLSKEEYDKYIINGTADGSISKCDQNTYHYITNESKAVCFAINLITPPNADLQRVSGLSNVELMFYYYGREIYHQSRTSTVYGHFELISDNSKDKNSITNTVIPKFKAVYAYYTNPDSSYPYYWNGIVKDVNIDINSINKTDMSASKTDEAADGHNNRMILTVNYNLYFRPVFFYIDNNKSKNIYY